MITNDAHDRWDDLLPEYVAGQIKDIERTGLEAHLTTCPQCQHELERLRALASFLTREDADAPSDRTFEAGWNQLVTMLPPRESVTATAHIERTLRTLDVGTFQDAECSNLPGQLSVRPKRQRIQWRDAVRLMAAVAALVAIVGSLALIGLHQIAAPVPGCTSLPQDKVVPTGTPPAPNDKWELMSTPPAPTGLPSGTILRDIAMVSATEGWAAGSIDGLDRIKGEYTVKQGLILHYQHGSWTVSPDSPPHIQLQQFWTPAPGELWVWGRPVGQLDTVFLKYQDCRWQQSAPPMPVPTRADGAHFVMSEIRARTKDDIWMTGAFFGGSASNSTTPVPPVMDYEGRIPFSGPDLKLWHYNGSGWTSVPNMSEVGVVAPVGPDEAWVIAQYPSSPNPVAPRVLVHVIHGVATVGLNGMKLGGITNPTVISPTDVWASGETNKSKAALYHYDGASWTPSMIQIPSYITHITITGHDTLLGFTYDSVPDKRFGSTYSITQAFVYRDTQWQPVPWSIHQMAAGYGLRVTSAGDDVWAIGTYDIVWSKRNEDGTTTIIDPPGSVLLHYTNGAWTQYGS